MSLKEKVTAFKLLVKEKFEFAKFLHKLSKIQDDDKIDKKDLSDDDLEYMASLSSAVLEKTPVTSRSILWVIVSTVGAYQVYVGFNIQIAPELRYKFIVGIITDNSRGPYACVRYVLGFEFYLNKAFFSVIHSTVLGQVYFRGAHPFLGDTRQLLCYQPLP